jgi:hypothetical protein
VDESRAGPRCRSATVTGPMPMPMPAHGPSLSNRQACRNHAGSWLVEPRSVGKVGWENKKTLQCAIYCPFPPSLRPMPLMRERRGELIDTLRYTDTTSGTGHYSSSHRTCLTLPYSEGKCVTLSGEGSTPGDWQVPGPPPTSARWLPSERAGPSMIHPSPAFTTLSFSLLRTTAMEASAVTASMRESLTRPCPPNLPFAARKAL